MVQTSPDQRKDRGIFTCTKEKKKPYIDMSLHSKQDSMVETCLESGSINSFISYYQNVFIKYISNHDAMTLK